MPRRLPSFISSLAALIIGLPILLHAQTYENTPAITASDWWNEADWLKTDLWTVNDAIEFHNFTNHYTIDSVFGTFEASSDDELMNRLKEIQAIHALRKGGSISAGGKGVANVATDKLKVAENLATKPVTTVLDVPKGARAIVRRAGAFSRKEKRQGNYDGGGPFRGWLGANDLKREIAAKFEVDPYTDNAVLQKELERAATLEALPNFAVGFVIPGNGLFSVLATGEESRITDAYRADPSDLFVRNRRTLIHDLKVDPDLAAELLSSKISTPAQQTILVESLASLSGVPNRALFIEIALNAETRSQFDFYRREAELLAWYHKHRTPIRTIENFRWLPVATDRSGKRVLPFAVDYGGWCPECGGFLSDFSDAGNGDVVLINGRLTDTAVAALKNRGVEVVRVST